MKTDTAPGWRLRCRKCGRAKPASTAGVTRVGAATLGKAVLGWCKRCHWFQWLVLEREPQAVATPAGADAADA